MTTGYLSVIAGQQPNVLGKVFSLKAGVLHKETAGYLSVGSYSVQSFGTVGELAALLEGIGTDQCITASLPLPHLPPSGCVVAKDLQADYPGSITRTKADMGFRVGAAGVMALDYDPQAGDAVLSPADLWSLLQTNISGLQTAGVVHWLSGSSHIWDGEYELP